MSIHQLQYLFEKHMQGTLDAAEKEALRKAVLDAEHSGSVEALKELIEQYAVLADPVDSTEGNQILQRVISVDAGGSADKLKDTASGRISLLRRWYVAASVLLVLAAGGYIWTTSKKTAPTLAKEDKSLQTDIAPGTNRAILMVGNKSINLSGNKTGIAVGNSVTYMDGERIADAGELLQLVTPRGGQYQVVLPDGSKVWLNAASGIKFPSRFAGEAREVQVTGEVYMEIAKNARQPFFVRTANATVQVLGTSFNINAYENEQEEKTTLIEGSVKVQLTASPKIAGLVLKPGQQAVLKQHAPLKVRSIDPESVVAWKNGFFNFDGMPLEEALKQLERWYEITVKYEGRVPDRYFEGKIDRELSLSQLLKILKETGVNFRLEGRTLIIREN